MAYATSALSAYLQNSVLNPTCANCRLAYKLFFKLLLSVILVCMHVCMFVSTSKAFNN